MSATQVQDELFGLADGKSIMLYTLASDGLVAKITNYGGIVVSLEAPDRRGDFADLVLGFDKLEPYRTNPAYFGAIVGRYANLIANAQFTLGGNRYQLARNDGRNSLHGGPTGFHKRVWSVREIAHGIELAYRSVDGEEGFPGTLEVRVNYTVQDGDLKIDYSAQTDRETVISLTNHSYFNLAGHKSGSILAHELQLEADSFTPTDRNQIPTGELRGVASSSFDFNRPFSIGSRIDADDDQLIIGKGYDHNWVLRELAAEPCLAARLRDPRSGRVLEVLTTEPGIQFYSGNLLNGIAGKDGARYDKRSGLCLETQHFPDSPNKPQFPSTVLRPGDRFWSTTIYRSSTV